MKIIAALIISSTLISGFVMKSDWKQNMPKTQVKFYSGNKDITSINKNTPKAKSFFFCIPCII